MRICPFCDQSVPESELENCSACGKNLMELSDTGYLQPLQFLAGTLQKALLGQLTGAAALEQFEHWLGTVQQVLNQAYRDLETNLKPLSKLEDVDTLEIIKGFGIIQQEIAGQLDRLSTLFRGCKSIQDFEQRFPQMEEALDFFHAHLTDLELYVQRIETPRGPDPLPDDVRQALDALEQALGCMNEFYELRQADSLENLLDHLEVAQQRVRSYLEAH